MNKGKRIAKWIVLGIIAVFVFGSVVMMLWNWLVPELFNGPQITFWQALGLLLLSKLLFWGGGHSHHKSHNQAGFFQKLSKMTPEERETFKRRMKEKWCTPSPDNDANV